ECTSDAPSRASSMNCATISGLMVSSVFSRFTTNCRRKPSAPWVTASDTFAMPPSPSGATSMYRLFTCGGAVFANAPGPSCDALLEHHEALGLAAGKRVEGRGSSARGEPGLPVGDEQRNGGERIELVLTERTREHHRYLLAVCGRKRHARRRDEVQALVRDER